MDIGYVHININGCTMALQIANPVVVEKVNRLARATGLSKTAVVEKAIDRLASELNVATDTARMSALLSQLDQVPERADRVDPLEWDAQGLPI